MIEMLQTLATALCSRCQRRITLCVGEWSPETWSHDENGRPECPGAATALPAEGTIVVAPETRETTDG